MATKYAVAKATGVQLVWKTTDKSYEGIAADCGVDIVDDPPSGNNVIMAAREVKRRTCNVIITYRDGKKIKSTRKRINPTKAQTIQNLTNNQYQGKKITQVNLV